MTTEIFRSFDDAEPIFKAKLLKDEEQVIYSKLAPEKIEECKKIFDQFDEACVGTIVNDLIGKAVRLLGENPTDSVIEELIREVDADDDGELYFNEFICILVKTMSHRIEHGTKTAVVDGANEDSTASAFAEVIQ